MKTRIKVSAHDGKLVIDLPLDVVFGLRLEEGDEVDVEIARAAHSSLAVRQNLVALRKYRGRLPAGFKFDRDEANRR